MPAAPSNHQLREIARDIVCKLLDKSGVQDFSNSQPMLDIARRAVEVTNHIAEAYPVKDK